MSSPVSTVIGDGIYPGPSQPGHPCFIGAMSTGDGFDHLWKEMSEVTTVWHFIN